MTTKYYALKANYVLPAGSFGATYIDGVYMNGQLFEDNIPVIDGVIRIDVQPRYEHWVDHYANFGFPTFQNGQVIRIGKKFHWNPWSNEAQSHDLQYNGHPYGMGLNTIAIELSLFPVPITKDIVYEVLMAFIMEVG